MAQAREQSRAGGGIGDARQSLLEFVQHHDLRQTEFKGYSRQFVVDGACVLAKLVLNGEVYEPIDKLIVGEPAAVVTDQTPFYAEAGGQVGDTGYIRTHEGAVFRVNDTIKFAGVHFHLGELESSSIHKDRPAFGSDDKVLLEVDAERRERIMANHTATHMLNKALRDLVNPEADQRGSLVDGQRLRFDFANATAVGPEQLDRVESQVNGDIEADMPVHAGIAPQDEARRIRGLRAVFGEKYPPRVRVVAIGQPVPKILEEPENEQWAQYSIEFCGGTHLQTTSEAERFVVTSEEAVAKGVRRMTALTGKAARDAEATASALVASLESIRKMPDERLAGAVSDLQDQMTEATIPVTARARLRAGLESLHKRIKKQQKQAAAESAGQVVEQARRIADESGGPVIVARLEGADGQTLRQAMDVIRKKRPEAAMLLGSTNDDKVAFLAAVPPSIVDRGLKAGDWVREVAKVAGGGGGGKPDMAQAGGKDPTKLDDALQTGRCAGVGLGAPGGRCR
jgi:alanyl-tRNA synthetase